MSFWVEMHCDYEHEGCENHRDGWDGTLVPSVLGSPTMNRLGQFRRLAVERDGWRMLGRDPQLAACPSCARIEAQR